MARKCLIATVGGEIGHVRSAVGEIGWTLGDRLVMVVARGREPGALSDVFKFLRAAHGLSIGDASVYQAAVDPSDPLSCAAEVRREIVYAVDAGMEVHVDVSGGPRYLAFLLYLAAVTLGHRIAGIYCEDGTGRMFDLPGNVIVRETFEQGEFETLAVVARLRESTRVEIAVARGGRNPQVVWRHLSKLERLGMIARTGERRRVNGVGKRPSLFSVAPLGVLYLGRPLDETGEPTVSRGAR